MSWESYRPAASLFLEHLSSHVTSFILLLYTQLKQIALIFNWRQLFSRHHDNIFNSQALDGELLFVIKNMRRQRRKNLNLIWELPNVRKCLLFRPDAQFCSSFYEFFCDIMPLCLQQYCKSLELLLFYELSIDPSLSWWRPWGKERIISLPADPSAQPLSQVWARFLLQASRWLNPSSPRTLPPF